MKKMILMGAFMLCFTSFAFADEVVTVSANNADISANLDLKIVAKLFGEAKNLEEFETMLNNPDSAFVNLDLNGDGQVDYIRVIETNQGYKHLIVLQAVLAIDIYQDVANIYVEKDEATNQVSVQVIGDEYLYGTNYIIEPVYVYRPIIYDWFWSPYWTCWNSPWYWGYYPMWWYPWACVAPVVYINHCYACCQHHSVCSFRYTQTARASSRTMGDGIRRNDFAQAQPQRSFNARNSGVTNARQLENTVRRPTVSDRAKVTTRALATDKAVATPKASAVAATSKSTAQSTSTYKHSTASTASTGTRQSSRTTATSSPQRKDQISASTATKSTTSSSSRMQPTTSSSHAQTARSYPSSNSEIRTTSVSSGSRPSSSGSMGGGASSRSGGSASTRR